MDDPDWMNDFKSPTEDALMLSSPSPSSSPDMVGKKEEFLNTGQDESENNGKDDSDDEDSPLITAFIKAGRAVKSGGKGRGRSSLGSSTTSQETGNSPGNQESAVANEAAKVAMAMLDDDDDDVVEKKPVVFMSRRPRGLKRALESEEEDGDAEQYESPSKIRKSAASPQVNKDGIAKAPNSGRKGRRVSFSEEEEPAKFKRVKRVKREVQLMEPAVIDEDDDESVPLSSLVRKDKKRTASGSPVSHPVAVDAFRAAASAATLVLKKEPLGATGLISVRDGRDAAGDADDALLIKEETGHGDDALFTKEETVHDEEAGDASERKAKPRASSSLPVIFADKVNRTKVLLECEGDALDLSGDMGAVGRFSVSSGQQKGDNELLLDLKGIIYKTTIVPSNTFFVVNVGHSEAKVEAIMNNFMQLQPDLNQVEDETIVEGTLEGFAFDIDNEGEPLSTPVSAPGPVDSDADEDTKQKKKTPTKAQKQNKIAAGKGGKGSRTKVTGKGATAKKAKAKSKAGTKKPSKTKPATAKKAKKP